MAETKTSPLGKYLLIEVPNYNLADGEDGAMSSYLRLGAVKDPSIAASPSAPKASGEDLAAKVTSFIDDERVRDGCPEFIPVSERKAETEKLHIKGGWRDHSDGNRITTTRGDKVEVIQGNYRMLVLGRQQHDSGWDVSGGHVSENGITFEGSSEIRWVENYDGTWRVIEESLKGDVFTTYQGDTHEEYYGNIKKSTTGSEAPKKGRENPSITDRTWARMIESYTGSEALPVPSIKDETWADTITSKTVANKVTDTTEVRTLMKSTTRVGTIEDATTADAMRSTTNCPSMLDTTTGNRVSTMIGTDTEIVVGAMTELTVGAETAITVGAVIDIVVAMMLDVCIAGRLEVNIGPSIELNSVSKFELSPSEMQDYVNSVEKGLKKTVLAARTDFI
ncbi:hypothetical protein [Polyangium aurulentum]|uniref:hypothetical protein n=1 Tax=Polyangium aurulentum TaxID=2567896 RepID=UPI0010AEA4DB|nr:hypothetical protein [Polyangium aurulentum]UQA57785.1 hypothetical protein E8A73_041995 [Polyangium aurulentum]